jgi:hypothetical protein
MRSESPETPAITSPAFREVHRFFPLHRILMAAWHTGPAGFSEFPNNSVGEIKPGSAAPDKTVLLSPSVASSVGALNFVPSGFPGSGGFKIVSYRGGGFYDAALTPDGSGTYNISAATRTASTGGGGPEGFVYVPTGSTDFAAPSMLLSQYTAGSAVACGLDSGGNHPHHLPKLHYGTFGGGRSIHRSAHGRLPVFDFRQR